MFVNCVCYVTVSHLFGSLHSHFYYGRKLADRVQQFIGEVIDKQEERTDDPIMSQVNYTSHVCVEKGYFLP